MHYLKSTTLALSDMWFVAHAHYMQLRLDALFCVVFFLHIRSFGIAWNLYFHLCSLSGCERNSLPYVQCLCNNLKIKNQVKCECFLHKSITVHLCPEDNIWPSSYFLGLFIIIYIFLHFVWFVDMHCCHCMIFLL